MTDSTSSSSSKKRPQKVQQHSVKIHRIEDHVALAVRDPSPCRLGGVICHVDLSRFEQLIQPMRVADRDETFARDPRDEEPPHVSFRAELSLANDSQGLLRPILVRRARCGTPCRTFPRR